MWRWALILLLLPASAAQARTVEAGDLYLRAGLGAHGHLSPLPLATPAASLHVLAEYAIDRNWLLSGGYDHRLSATPLFGAKLGARYRFTGFVSAISPYLGVHALIGGMFPAQQGSVGMAAAVLSGGVDFFLTARWLLGIDLEAYGGSTLRPAAQAEAVGGLAASFVVTYRLYSPFGSKPVMPLDQDPPVEEKP